MHKNEIIVYWCQPFLIWGSKKGHFETYISQLQIMKIVHLFVGKKYKICGFGDHFLLCKFVGKGH